jgi:hypothetical protein
MAGGKKKRKGGGGGATPSPARPQAAAEADAEEEAEAAATPGASEPPESPSCAAEPPPSPGAADEAPPSAADAPPESPAAEAQREPPVPPTPLEERAAADVHSTAAPHAALPEEAQPPLRPPSPPSPPNREALPDASPAPRSPAGLRRTSTGSVPVDGSTAAALADAAAARAELAEVRAEYEAFRASTAEICQQLQGHEEDAAASRSRLAEATAASELRLARAEAALERERARALTLADAAAAERATAEALRGQLSRADADATLARAELGAVRAELNRLRDSAAMQQRSAELRDAADEAGDAQRAQPGGAAAVAGREGDDELRRRAEGATALVEKLMADNDTLTELVNEQAQILNAIRAARISAQQPARTPSRPAEVVEDSDERASTPEQQPDEDAGAAASPVAGAAASPAVASELRAVSTLQEARPSAPPAKPQRWVLGRIWAHVAGYDNAPPRG